MKLKQGFMVHEADGISMLISTGTARFSGVVRGNKTFGAILQALQQDVSREELISTICGKYEVSSETVEKDVDKAITELRRIGAIDG